MSEQSKNRNLLPLQDDLVMVTGGAKGITLECVRSLGIATSCCFILLGKSKVEEDPLLRKNLEYLKESNVKFEYYSCDIDDNNALKTVFTYLAKHNRTITGIIHAAGVNIPQKIANLSKDDIRKTLAPKLNGLRNVISFVNLEKVKFCISFGSVIAETGMAGNADYSLANHWLQQEVHRMSAKYPSVRFINIEWSVWGGTGMGQDLGVLETLKRQGIQPISIDNGLRILLDLFRNIPEVTNVIVSGRYGKMNTINFNTSIRPGLYRFVEDIKVFYPGIELVADCNLSTHTDWYLNDHVVEGNILFPAVFGLEAMVQAIATLVGMEPAAIEIDKAEFLHPVIVGSKPKRVRVIAQHKIDNVYSAVIRDEDTRFRKDHFRATFIIKNNVRLKKVEAPSRSLFDPSIDLYRSLLFHRGIFCRVTGYYTVTPYCCIASAAGSKERFLSDLLPRRILLADPFLNDAVLQAVQVCVPDKTLLPVRMDNVDFYTTAPTSEIVINAKEVMNQGDEYVYDIFVTNISGQLLQSWKGITFKAIKKNIQIPDKLVKIVLQRRLDKLACDPSAAIVHFNEPTAIKTMIKRADGKPVKGAGYISKSGYGDKSFLVEGKQEFLCDMEMIHQQPDEAWQGLLGKNKFYMAKNIKNETGEDISTVSTRIWCALECGRKAGLQEGDPLIFEKYDQADDTVYFTIGRDSVMTYRCLIEGKSLHYIFALVIKKEYEKTI